MQLSMRVCSRKAFTLLEILLVVALIVALVAFSYPAIQTMYRHVRVEAGVDDIKTAMIQARLHAIEQGRPYRVAIVPGSWNVRVAPELPEFWDGSDSASFSEDENTQPYVEESEAPDGVYFSLLTGTGQNETLTTGQVVEDQQLSSQISSSEWKTAAVFFPDGTAHEDVKIYVSYKGSFSMILKLRALTGGMTSRRATDEEMERMQPAGDY